MGDSMAQTGRILSGVGGFYEVEAEDGVRHTCRARGKFRIQEDMTPAVGDWVRFAPKVGEEDGYLLEILPRRNRLLRPAVSNIDLMAVVLSASRPQPDLMLADRLLAQAEGARIRACVCINKCDEAKPGVMEALAGQFRHLQTFPVSARSGQGVAALRQAAGKGVLCLAGQSGVGKSSLINALCPELDLETGSVSRKIGRGRHTTRSVQLLPLPEGGFVVDTPGFSLLEGDAIPPEELMHRYPDFAPYWDDCRFAGCLHDKEPDCAVKAAVAAGHIPQARHARYCQWVEELQEQWRNRYD